jgi:inhibitor of cysteine peptidase
LRPSRFPAVPDSSNLRYSWPLSNRPLNMAPPAFRTGSEFWWPRAVVAHDCTIAVTPPDAGELNAPVDLAQDDSGRTITAAVGEELVIGLAENPTTGYRWQAEFDTSILQASGDRYDASSPLRGAPGTRFFSYTTLQPGETTLTLVNRRSWEQGAGIDQFVIDLEVGTE